MTKIYDITEFNRIISEVKTSVVDDIHPMLQMDKRPGGYFGVPRAILCYVDYLGLLHSGWDGTWNKSKTNKQNFGSSETAKSFIAKYFTKVDNQYKEVGTILYDMYRHGTVHLYCPKKFKAQNNENETIEWLTYKGSRREFLHVNNGVVELEHLHIKKIGEDRFVLPVSINELYDDLISAINLYSDDVINNNNLLKNAMSVAEAIDKHHDSTTFEFSRYCT